MSGQGDRSEKLRAAMKNNSPCRSPNPLGGSPANERKKWHLKLI
jgi:hypothetical protein